MSVLTVGALLVALLVAAPIAAHLLRRRNAEERPFPPARLVPPTPPVARRRSRLEDRALFATRALSVVALAVLGATPLVRCSRLALARQGGASVALAIVIDDSLSMRAPLGGTAGGPSRFERAVSAARELVSSSRAGDAIGVVLAGAPARVALAATTDTAAVLDTLDALSVTDRATDLDGAVALGRALLEELPQIDRRVVLLSDFADGTPDAPPIGGEDGIRTWAPVPELASGNVADCAILAADRAGGRVSVHVACARTGSAPDPAANRSVEIRIQSRVLGAARLEGPGGDVTIDLPSDAPAEGLVAALDGSDSIASDDRATVLASTGALRVAVVADAESHVETGGPPPVEQALAALELGVELRPLPGVPEHREDLDALGALVVDDAPGLTPEVRKAVAAWVERGGTLLVTLGPRAAAAPLGAGFDPIVPGVIRWMPSPVDGADPAHAPVFGPAAQSLVSIAPKGRAVLEPVAHAGSDVLVAWKDGAPLWFRRSLGRGAVFVLTLPFDLEQSDLALRPAFLAMLERFVGAAQARGGARRIDAGETWTFDGYRTAVVRRVGPEGAPLAVVVREEKGRPRATPDVAGLYELVLDGESSMRAVGIPAREIDFRQRPVHETARDVALGGATERVDVSREVALVLLGLVALELVLRVAGARAARADASTTGAA